MKLHILGRSLTSLAFLGLALQALATQPQAKTLDSLLKQIKGETPAAIAEAAAELRLLIAQSRHRNPIKAEEQQAIASALMERFADKDPAVRLAVVRAMSDIGIRDKALLAAIARAAKDADAAVQLAAHGALWTLSGDDDSFKAITAALKSPAAETRISTISVIEFADNPKTLAALLPVAKDPDDLVAFRARVVIHRLCGVLRGQAKAAVPDMMERLNAEDVHSCREAAGALADIGVEAKAALPALIRELKKPNNEAAPSMVHAIGRIGSDGATVIPALSDALTDKNAAIRREAAFALGYIGPDAKPSTIALRQAADDADGNVRVAARLALWRVLNEDAQLKRAMDDAAAQPNSGAIVNACAWLSGLEPPAIASLMDQLKHPSAQVRKNAMLFLSWIDPPPKQFVPALIALLQDPDESVRKSAAKALREIAPEAAKKAGIK